MGLPNATAKSQYGRTTADALAFLAQADTVLISVRVALDWPCVYLGLAPDAVRPALVAYRDDEPIPSEYQPATRTLVLGSLAAIAEAA